MLRFKKLFTSIAQCNEQNWERIKDSAFPFPFKSLDRMEARWGHCVRWAETTFSETEDILTGDFHWNLLSTQLFYQSSFQTIIVQLLGQSKPWLAAAWTNCCPMTCQDPKLSKAIASSQPLAGNWLQSWCPIDSFWDCGITFCNLIHALSFNTWGLQHY